MLRNQQKSQQLLKHLFTITQQLRFIQQQKSVLCNKNTNVVRQGKIMGKLFGHRVSGSKKRWFPSETDSKTAANQHLLFQQTHIGKPSSGGGKHSTRRITVLNKLFMKHITDLMATGEISESILGKGLQVSRVKISQDFAYINVFWMASGTVDKDLLLENELKRCTGLLRHELSQLGLMGVVPRINFVKDKLYDNMYQVENLLRNMDFGTQGEDEILAVDLHKADVLKQDFYGNKINITKQQELSNDENLSLKIEHLVPAEFEMPEMRHDVLGLDHKGIMIKILTKMRKSKQAWDQHLQNSTVQKPANANSIENSSTIHSTSFSELVKTNEKLAKVAANSEKFEAFLAKRKERRNTPERKKFRVHDHQMLDVNADADHDYLEQIMSKHQRQLYEAEDYLDDLEHKKL